MKKSKFTDHQIAFAVQPAEVGVAVEEVRRTPLVGQPTGLNKVVGLAARETPICLARLL